MAGKWVKNAYGETTWEGDTMPTPADYADTTPHGVNGVAPYAAEGPQQPTYSTINTWGVQEPTYISNDPSKYQIAPGIKSDLAGIQGPDMAGLSAARGEATRTGLGKGSRLAMDKLKQDTQAGRNRLGMTSAGEAAGARSSLMMHGGGSSGANERIATNAVRANVAGNQELSAAEASGNAGIGMEDEKNRLNMLGNLGGIENQYAKTGLDKARIQATASGVDANNYMRGQESMNKWNQDKYANQMGLRGAELTANATANSGKK